METFRPGPISERRAADSLPDGPIFDREIAFNPDDADSATSGIIEVTSEMMEDAEIEGFVDGIKPTDTEQAPSSALAIYSSDVPYISDAMFKEAGAASESTPPPDGAGSVISMDDLMRADILKQVKERHHIDLIDDPPIPMQILWCIKGLLLDGDHIADEKLVKETLLLTLPALDPVTCKKDERLEQERASVLFRVFRRVLRKRGEYDLADKLETRSFSTPPPLPTKQ